MSLPDRTTVLIVGAGPTGLSAALSLLHQGLRDFVIVDASHQNANLSRAMILNAGTLEALDTMNCGDDVVSQGLKISELHAENRSARLGGLNMDFLKPYTRHPYLLSISQNVVEHALEKKLASFGVIVQRPFKVVGLARNLQNSQVSDVTFEDGTVITATYVIGADGAHSAIRSLAGIGFSDPTFVKGDDDHNLAQMIVADVIFDNSEAVDLIPRSIMSAYSLFLLFPLPTSFNECSADDDNPVPVSERVYRIYCGVPVEEGEIPRSRSLEYVQGLVDRFGPKRISSDPSVNPSPKPTRVKRLVWSSRFRHRTSIADSVFVRLGSGEHSGEGGAVLIIGDAAHIHSPAGGQGMNLGMRDGIFLGEALAKHFHATETQPLSEADKILRDFAVTRHARALAVINVTKRMVSIEALKYRERMAWWLPIDSETFRGWLFWAVGHLPFLQGIMVWETSALGNM